LNPKTEETTDAIPLDTPPPAAIADIEEALRYADPVDRAWAEEEMKRLSDQDSATASRNHDHNNRTPKKK
jgi:hypothetical protein